MVPNRMVPVEGELSVASTTEQERIEAAFDEGTLALQARSREEHVLRWIYRSENMGQAGQRGSPISLKPGFGGTAGATPAATSAEWSLFCSSLSRSGASCGRNAPFFREPYIRIYFFAPERSNCLFFGGGRKPCLARERL